MNTISILILIKKDFNVLSVHHTLHMASSGKFRSDRLVYTNEILCVIAKDEI